ncbi:c-type cytochrome [Methylobacterium sp. JK268]
MGTSLRAAAALLLAGLAASAAGAEPAPPEEGLSRGAAFAEQGGEALYASVCAACHMGDGKGAAGAARYPALAGDPNLAAGGYPVLVLVRGLRGMPPLGRMMTDAQVADVVNYVRSHFGNAYADAVTPADVAASRP